MLPLSIQLDSLMCVQWLCCGPGYPEGPETMRSPFSLADCLFSVHLCISTPASTLLHPCTELPHPDTQSLFQRTEPDPWPSARWLLILTHSVR